jgi:hypothetical protein
VRQRRPCAARARGQGRRGQKTDDRMSADLSLRALLGDETIGKTSSAHGTMFRAPVVFDR